MLCFLMAYTNCSKESLNLHQTLNHLHTENSCWFKKRRFSKEFMAWQSSRLFKKGSQLENLEN